MDSTSCKPHIAIVYTSVTGNTETLAEMVCSSLNEEVDVSLLKANEFSVSFFEKYDAVIVGTYTWGNGNIPREMRGLYEMFESVESKKMVTAVFGTGDSFYPNYCGAVDQFRDMLFVHTNLAVTLKVELLPQTKDMERCRKFAEIVLKRLKSVTT